MKRALVLLISVAAVITGCGSSSSSGSSSGSAGSTSGGSSSVSTNSAAGVLAAASASTKTATSAAFDAKLGVTVAGNLQGAGAGAALLKGPLTFEFKGHAGTAGAGKSKFDVNFAFNYTGGSFTGEALSPDGKTLYLQLPALMGSGWKSLSLAGLTQAGSSGSSSSTSGGLDALKAAGLDPSKLLKNLTMSTSGGQDTISADVDLAAVFAAIQKADKSATGLSAKQQAQIAQLEKAITKAHGSLSFDSSTHLPTDEQLQFAMTVPPSLSSSASGLKSIALNLDIKFSDWNNDFTVTAPKGATPLNTGGLLGGLGSTA
ncbi:MAG: hypothetical protein ABJB93_08825 [Gaiellales bacterium]